MKQGLGDRPEVERTLDVLRHSVRLPPSVRAAGSLIEPVGQIPITIAHEIDTTDAIGALAHALRGRFNKIPLAIKRDLENEAERHRRWEGRRGDHAKGRARLKIGLDVEPAGAETPEEALSRRMNEDREKVLGIEADAVISAAGTLEAQGKRRSAQLLRRDLYKKLGGKKKRTPEVRKRRQRKD